MLRLIKRHIAACQKRSQKDFKCKCSFTVTGPHPVKRGERFTETLDTADQALASLKLREIEMAFFREPEPEWTLAKACREFRNTKARKSRERQNKIRRVLNRQTLFLALRYKILDAQKAAEIEKLEREDKEAKIEQIGHKIIIKKTPPHPQKTDIDAFLTTFTGTMTSNDRDRSLVSEFWRWCFDSDITSKNIGSKLMKFGGSRERELHAKKRRPAYSNEEKQAVWDKLTPETCRQILKYENGQDPEASERTRVFELIQIFTGFAISDVVTLRFDELKTPHADEPDQVPIEHFRIKTGKTAYPYIPLWLAEELRHSFTPASAEYPFWSGVGDPESCAQMFRARMKKIFIAAGVRVYERMKKKKSAGKTQAIPELVKDSHADPHFWRHTFVRDCYLEDISVTKIAKMLGDDEAAIVKYYSCFDELRGRALAKSARKLHQNRMPSQPVRHASAFSHDQRRTA